MHAAGELATILRLDWKSASSTTTTTCIRTKYRGRGLRVLLSYTHSSRHRLGPGSYSYLYSSRNTGRSWQGRNKTRETKPHVD